MSKLCFQSSNLEFLEELREDPSNVIVGVGVRMDDEGPIGSLHVAQSITSLFLGCTESVCQPIESCHGRTSTRHINVPDSVLLGVDALRGRPVVYPLVSEAYLFAFVFL